MSQTKAKTGRSEKDLFLDSLRLLIDESKKIPPEFWQDTEHRKYKVIWLLNRQKPSVEVHYDFDQERVGITSDGHVIYGFDSGCSCPDPWVTANQDDCLYQAKEWKQFKMDLPEIEKLFDPTWMQGSNELLSDLMYLVRDDTTAKDIFKVRNLEVRRNIIRNLGYEQIKKELKVKVIDTDPVKKSELFDVEFKDEQDGRRNTIQRFLKVKDASTPREYILAVPGPMDGRAPNTCAEAVAWTFGVEVDEYKPEIET